MAALELLVHGQGWSRCAGKVCGNLPKPGNKTNVFTLYIKQTVRFSCSIVTNKEMNDYTNITLRIGRTTFLYVSDVCMKTFTFFIYHRMLLFL